MGVRPGPAPRGPKLVQRLPVWKVRHKEEVRVTRPGAIPKDFKTRDPQPPLILIPLWMGPAPGSSQGSGGARGDSSRVCEPALSRRWPWPREPGGTQLCFPDEPFGSS